MTKTKATPDTQKTNFQIKIQTSGISKQKEITTKATTRNNSTLYSPYSPSTKILTTSPIYLRRGF